MTGKSMFIVDYLLLIPEVYVRTKALRALIDFPMYPVKKHKVNSIFEAVVDGFYWKQTEEGQDFWYAISEKARIWDNSQR